MFFFFFFFFFLDLLLFYDLLLLMIIITLFLLSAHIFVSIFHFIHSPPLSSIDSHKKSKKVEPLLASLSTNTSTIVGLMSLFAQPFFVI